MTLQVHGNRFTGTRFTCSSKKLFGMSLIATSNKKLFGWRSLLLVTIHVRSQQSGLQLSRALERPAGPELSFFAVKFLPFTDLEDLGFQTSDGRIIPNKQLTKPVCGEALDEAEWRLILETYEENMRRGHFTRIFPREACAKDRNKVSFRVNCKTGEEKLE